MVVNIVRQKTTKIKIKMNENKTEEEVKKKDLQTKGLFSQFSPTTAM